MADPEQDKLDELERRIQDVRHHAEEDGDLPAEHAERTFADPEGDGVDDPYKFSPPG